MKRISKVIILLFLVFSASSQCLKNEVLSKYTDAKILLEKQEKDLSGLLSGENTVSSSLSNLFGDNFDVQKTPIYISELQKKLNEKNTIPIEMSGMYSCLLDLKLEKENEEFLRITDSIINLKIKVLAKNKELNNSLKEGASAQEVLPDLKTQIHEESSESQKLKRELESSVALAEKELLNEKNRGIKELLEAKGRYSKLKIEIINTSLNYNKELEANINRFEEISKRISLISSEYSLASVLNKQSYFEEIEKTWSEIIRRNFMQMISSEDNLNIPKVPNITTASDNLKENKAWIELVSIHTELKQLRMKTVKDIADKKANELKLQNSLLIRVNSLRSNLYEVIPTSYFLGKIVTVDYWNSLRKEIIASPYRMITFFYGKYVYIKEHVTDGASGIKKLVLDVTTLLFFVVVLVLINFCLKFVFKQFDRFIIKMSHRYSEYQLLNLFVSYWHKLKDNLPIVSWLIIIAIAIPMKEFENFLFILEILQIILLSKVLKSIIVLFLGNISRIDTRSYLSFKEKSDSTSSGLINIFLIYYISMIVVEGTLGRVYVYSLINLIALTYSAYLLIVKSSVWEDEFLHYLERKFSGALVDKVEKFVTMLPVKIRAVFYLVVLVVFEFFYLFIRLTENFEISKKVSANLFKRQLESLEVDEKLSIIPESYNELFSLHSVEDPTGYVKSSNEIEDSILGEINSWIEDEKEEHSLVIYGDKGVGKTSLIKYLESELGKQEIDCLYLKIPAKTTSARELETFLFKNEDFFAKSEMVKSEDYLESDDDSVSAGKQVKKVVFLDETQNVFLSHCEGFEAYYYLVNLVNSNKDDIFWVMAFNKYSWLFLDRAFGRNQFFRNVFELKGWSDIKIKELIMKRHSGSKLKLSYDSLISATRSEDEIDKYASIEAKFFKLLWEVSNGNPRSALFLWLTALSLKNSNTLNVNIPRFVDIKGLDKMSDELLFVIAHVLKHENLTVSEIKYTTNLAIGLVRNAVKVCLERDYLFRDNNKRYMIDITTQYSLIKYLRARNFIYGN